MALYSHLCRCAAKRKAIINSCNHTLITTEFVSIFAQCVTSITNTSLRTGYFPSTWRKAVVFDTIEVI